jgi:hypothetical protein
VAAGEIRHDLQLAVTEGHRSSRAALFAVLKSFFKDNPTWE